MSAYVIDTNVISEASKRVPNPGVLEFMATNSPDLHLTAITIEELRFGEMLMPSGRRRSELKRWIDSLLREFDSKILPFDSRSAEVCAELHERAVSSGHAPTMEDLMIASIAKVHGYILVTRNIKDFEYLGIPLKDPFE